MDEHLDHGMGDSIDADAVCAQCGTINREGVFICKTCGNNLRDQRALRLSAEKELEGVGAGIDHRRFLRGALTVLGLLVVAWVGLNVDGITEWLISIQTPVTASAGGYWDDAALNELSGSIDLDAYSDSELNAAIENPDPQNSLDGFYVLAADDRRNEFTPAGVAHVRQENDQLLFAARLYSGADVRGYADIRANQIVAELASTGVQFGRKTFAFFGVAVSQGDGSYSCMGQSEISNETYKIYAYPLAP